MACTDEQLRRLIAALGPTVYKLAIAQTRSVADADDIYQDVFLRYIRCQPEFNDLEHQRAWFIRVTVNCCKDYLKRAARRDVPLTGAEAISAALPAQNEKLDEALAALPAQQRALIHLYYYEGYKSDEIARILEMNPSTVRTGLKRARKKLRDFMEGESF